MMTRFMSQDHSSKKSIDDKRDLEKLLLTNLVIYFHFCFLFPKLLDINTRNR